jgi:serine/threonine-protein kinase RIO1
LRVFAVKPRLSSLEEELAGILAELYGEGVDVVQLLFCEGLCVHADGY